jgi:hypothetical protein
VFFGDPVVATALLDHLLHHAIVIQIEGQAIDFANTPISCRKTADPEVSSNHRRSRRLSNVADGRRKTEASINTTADHPARQTGEFYFAIIGEIPRAIDRPHVQQTPSNVMGNVGLSREPTLSDRK